LVLIFQGGSDIRASDYLPGELLVRYKPGAYPKNLKGELAKIGWTKIKIDKSKSMSQAMMVLKKNPNITHVEPNYYGEFLSEPNDPDFDQQWYPPNIKAPEAWDKSLGQDVIVGLVDSGVDLTHEDLADNILPDGWDFGDDDDDPTDEKDHGTRVCGVIAAIQNNGLGISGIAPESNILPLKVNKGSSGEIEAADAAEAIIYASDYGVNIINLSIGWSDEEPQVITDAVEYAINTGVLLVAAAGQFYGEVVFFPAKLEEVIAVSATDDTNGFWLKSNYGPEIELSAPGVDIYTTRLGGGYATPSGTSFSAPIVSAVSALLIARYPGLTRDQVRKRLIISADDNLDYPGKDYFYGYGKVNALRSLDPGDADDDGILDDDDNCPYVANPNQVDADDDGIGDDCDNCPEAPNGPDGGTCTEGDVGNNCTKDDDCGTDGFCSMGQEDSDEDGTGDACDESTTTTSTTIPATTTTTVPITTTTSTIPTTTTTSIKPGPCSAEKIYGEDSANVLILRHLRDKIFSKTTEGQEIIRLYYQWSPVIVEAMEEDEGFKEEMREMIDGILSLIEDQAN
jgi:thermitase